MLSNFENNLRLFFRKRDRNVRAKSVHIDALDASNRSDYDDVFTGKLDYLLIRDFIRPDELDRFSRHYPELLAAQYPFLEKTKTGFFIGNSLLEKNSLDDYFNNAEAYHRHEKALLGFSFNERLSALIPRISGVGTSGIPHNAAGRSYLGNTIRVLEPDKAAFPAHTDKYVHDTHPKAQELNAQISAENMISFFAVLQNPDRGGRLFLFSKLYKDTSSGILNELTYGNFTAVQRYIYRFPSIRVDMQPGDLILFDAGQRWHMVEPIFGNQPRITVGSFTAYNKAKDAIYFWS